MSGAIYAIGLGSNRRSRHGSPADTLRAALARIGGVAVVSHVVASAPVGPSIRRYANAVALVASEEDPRALLARLKRIEAGFGRRRGQRWGARAIDLDILLWSGGAWSSRGLIVPHIAYRTRDFVIGPLATIAPGWRDPLTGRTARQLARRLTARARAPRSRSPMAGVRSSVGRASDF